MQSEYLFTKNRLKVTPMPPRMEIAPAAILAGLDTIVFWTREPLGEDEICELNAACGSRPIIERRGERKRGEGRLKEVWHPDFRLRYRVTLQQTSPEAVKVLSMKGGVHLTRVDPYLDWIFEDLEGLTDAFELLQRFYVKKYHRNQVSFVYHGKRGDTYYSGPRHASNVVAAYADKPCRTSGAAHCLHLEWRAVGAVALRRMGIRGVQDLLTFDHHKFWSGRLFFAKFDLEGLGRGYLNWQSGSTRRGPWQIPLGKSFYNMDLRYGGTIVRGLCTTQTVIDVYRKKFDVQRNLRSFDVSHLLPAASIYD